MSLLSIAILATALSPQAVQSLEEEVVVLGEQLDKGRVRAGSRDGEFYCEVRESTDDPDLNRIMCEGMKHCSAYNAELYATYEKQLAARSTRDAARQQMNAAMTQCFTTAYDRLVANLAEQRWQAKQAQQGEAE